MKLNDILENLGHPVPPQFISQKPLFSGGKKTGEAPYINWPNLCILLDANCGLAGWAWEVKGLQQVGKSLILIGALTIYGDDRSLTREATGYEDLDCGSYGDPSSNAEAMAVRRCCAKFGLGRALWQKDKSAAQNSMQQAVPRQTVPRPAVARQVVQNQGVKTLGISRDEWLKLKAEREANNATNQDACPSYQ